GDRPHPRRQPEGLPRGRPRDRGRRPHPGRDPAGPARPRAAGARRRRHGAARHRAHLRPADGAARESPGRADPADLRPQRRPARRSRRSREHHRIPPHPTGTARPLMLELLTPAEMGAADRAAIASGIPGIDLMEAAGRAVADRAAALVPEGPVLVVAGSGNNGGDGSVAARLLRERRRDVRLLLAADPARLKGDAATALARWNGPVLGPEDDLPDAAIVIDALFGAGL